MDDDAIHIHVIEGQAVETQCLTTALEAIPGRDVRLTRSPDINDGIEIILKFMPDVVFVFADGPPSAGLSDLERLHSGIPDVPIVAVIPDGRDILGEEALTKGAADYIPVNEITSSLVSRSIRYALQHHQLYETLCGLSLIDDATGFYNMAGFSTLVDYQMKLARRSLKRAFILRCRLENCDDIVALHGPREGDTALKAVAEMLRVTFRSTDILGRFSRTDFVCYVNDISGGTAQTVVNRLLHNIETFNKLCGGLYTFEIRVGIARIYGGDEAATVDELVAQAGEAMKAPEAVKLVT